MNIIIKIIIPIVTLVAVLFQIISAEIRSCKINKALYNQWFQDLIKETKYNLEIIEKLLKQDNSSKAVYDEVVRNYILELNYSALIKAKGTNSKILKKKMLKMSLIKETKYVFGLMNKTAKKLERLNRSMKIVPNNPSQNAPKILLMRQLPIFKQDFMKINEVLKCLPTE